MKYVLCYGDSNTWGVNPDDHSRFDFSIRWPGVVERELGSDFRIYENALNGRTTVLEDPIEEGRCGKTGFPVVLETCAPLDALVIMLGVNDLKLRFSMPAWDIGWGLDLLLQYVERAGCGRKGKTPKILVVSPPKIGGDWSKTSHGTVFDDSSVEKARLLPDIFDHIAKLHQAEFLNASLYTHPGVDCIHMTQKSHEALGLAIAKKLREMLLP